VATETSIRESVSKAVGEIPIIAPRSHLVLWLYHPRRSSDVLSKPVQE
jgi:hypothetical protein